jgi:hypothetical protein
MYRRGVPKLHVTCFCFELIRDIRTGTASLKESIARVMLSCLICAAWKSTGRGSRRVPGMDCCLYGIFVSIQLGKHAQKLAEWLSPDAKRCILNIKFYQRPGKMDCAPCIRGA